MSLGSAADFQCQVAVNVQRAGAGRITWLLDTAAALACQELLVDVYRLAQHHPITRDPLAGTNMQTLAYLHIAEGLLGFESGGLQHTHALGQESFQFVERLRGLCSSGGFQPAAESHEYEHHTADLEIDRPVVAQHRDGGVEVRRRHAQNEQRIRARKAVPQALPGVFQQRTAQPVEDRQREQQAQIAEQTMHRTDQRRIAARTVNVGAPQRHRENHDVHAAKERQPKPRKEPACLGAVAPIGSCDSGGEAAAEAAVRLRIGDLAPGARHGQATVSTAGGGDHRHHQGGFRNSLRIAGNW
jgi:hypothetical protein